MPKRKNLDIDKLPYQYKNKTLGMTKSYTKPAFGSRTVLTNDPFHENGLDAELIEVITKNGDTNYQGHQPSFDDYKRFEEGNPRLGSGGSWRLCIRGLR